MVNYSIIDLLIEAMEVGTTSPPSVGETLTLGGGGGTTSMSLCHSKSSLGGRETRTRKEWKKVVSCGVHGRTCNVSPFCLLASIWVVFTGKTTLLQRRRPLLCTVRISNDVRLEDGFQLSNIVFISTIILSVWSHAVLAWSPASSNQ